MEETIIRCDECGDIKKPSNGWFRVRVLDQIHLVVLKEDGPSAVGTIHDLCGQDCLHRHIDRFILTGSANRISSER